MNPTTHSDLLHLAYELSFWADPYTMEAELEEAHAQSLDLVECYGRGFGHIDLSVPSQPVLR